MSKFIPNERSKVYFAVGHEDYNSLAVSDFTSAVELTDLLISINASSQGNMVPTPNIGSLFETSIPGTVQAALSADFYRDDDPTKDVAWNTLPRGTEGAFFINRVGIEGEDPAAGDNFEVWPAMIVSRTMSNMSSNTAATFTVQCSVPEEPVESVAVSS